MKYIDAEKLKIAIKRRADFTDDMRDKLIDFIDIAWPYLTIKKKDWEEQEQFLKNKDFGKPLQQEQSKIDLEKEIEEHVIYMPHGEFASDNERQEDVEWAKKEFRHFYELGKLNARKEG